MKKMFILTLLAIAIVTAEAAVAQGLYFRDAVPGLAKQLVQNAKEKAALPNAKVVVGEFPDSLDQVLPFSRRLGEALIMDLSQAGAFAGVVERSRLSQILAEQGKTMSALYDEKDSPELGKLAGAKYMVLGSIAVSKAVIDVKLRLVAMDTGLTQSTAAIGILNTEEMAPLLKPRQVTTTKPEPAAKSEPKSKATVEAKTATTTPSLDPETDVKPTTTQTPADAKTVTAKPVVVGSAAAGDRGTMTKRAVQVGDPDVKEVDPFALKPYLLVGSIVLIALAALLVVTKKKDASATAGPPASGGGAAAITCGRCGSKIETDGQIAGQCTTPGCPTSICQACWAEHKDDRRCFQHTKT